MLNALVSLPFVLALLAAGVIVWHMLSVNGAKVAAALKGHSEIADGALATSPVRLRFAPRQVPLRSPVRTSARWRAAA